MPTRTDSNRRTVWMWRRGGMGSDPGCDCAPSRDDVLAGSGDGVGWDQITDATAHRAETTYSLEVEKERDGIRSRMRLHTEQRRRTFWMWRRRRMVKITDANPD